MKCKIVSSYDTRQAVRVATQVQGRDGEGSGAGRVWVTREKRIDTGGTRAEGRADGAKATGGPTVGGVLGALIKR